LKKIPWTRSLLLLRALPWRKLIKPLKENGLSGFRQPKFRREKRKTAAFDAAERDAGSPSALSDLLGDLKGKFKFKLRPLK